jgi:hypothetical protein
VKIGTIHFEQGTFEKGSIITVSEERAKLFDPATVEVIQETPLAQETTVNSETAATTPTVQVEQETVTVTPEPQEAKRRRRK